MVTQMNHIMTRQTAKQPNSQKQQRQYPFSVDFMWNSPLKVLTFDWGQCTNGLKIPLKAK